MTEKWTQDVLKYDMILTPPNGIFSPSIRQGFREIYGMSVSQAFCTACTSNHLELVQVLYTRFQVLISVDTISRVFNSVSSNLAIVKWLKKMTPEIDHTIDENAPFRLACTRGNLAMAKWLVSLGGINPHTQDEYAFSNACGEGHLELVQWFLERFPETDIRGGYNQATMNKKRKVRSWLLSTKQGRSIRPILKDMDTQNGWIEGIIEECTYGRIQEVTSSPLHLQIELEASRKKYIELQKTLEELQNSVTCIICVERNRNCVFLPCAHNITCMICGMSFEECPSCRQKIGQKIQIYN